MLFFFFFFNDTATTEIYTLSLHDALPISPLGALGGRAHIEDCDWRPPVEQLPQAFGGDRRRGHPGSVRSEEHTSELQSRLHLVCRLLLEKKKKKTDTDHTTR